MLLLLQVISTIPSIPVCRQAGMLGHSNGVNMFQFTNPQSVLLDLLAFLLTAIMAFTFEWQANELCWGLWISSLLTGWAVIISAVLRTILHLAGIPLLREEDLTEKGDPLSAYFRS